MKKVLYLFLVSLFIISLTGCTSQTNNTTEDEQEVSTNNNLETTFEDCNILSFSEITIDKNPKYEGDNYYYLKVKVKNNSKETVRVVTPTFSIYDSGDTILKTVDGQETAPLKGGQSVYIETITDKDNSTNNIKINNYSYYIGKTYYTVDLVSETAESYQ